MKFTVFCFLLFVLFLSADCWQCSSVTSVYSRLNNNAVLQFSADLSNINSPRNFNVKFHNDDTKATIRYNADKSVVIDAVPGVSVTADKSGNVVVTLENVQRTDAGIYVLITTGISTKCNCLYILGVPTQPAITENTTPSVGGSVILTCSSTTKTVPSNHSLSMTYRWKDGQSDIQSNDKYSFSANQDKLTVFNIVKTDANKQFTCTATEVVTNGYTSSRSDQFSFDVYYGPDNIRFSPSDIVYTMKENENLPQVTCNADCKPVCSFYWTKTGQQSNVSNNAVLNIGMLEASAAGIYKCSATRTGSTPISKDLTVHVIFGPRNMMFSPRAISYLHDENFDIPPITCTAECWECNYSWKGPGSFSSTEAVLDLGPLTKSMAGKYTCTARNQKYTPSTEKAKDLQVNVRYGPDSVTLTPKQADYTIDENSNIDDIKCEADCFPACTYKWKKEGQNNDDSQTGTLSLGKVQKSSAGKYICTATNGNDTSKFKKTNVMIHVRYGPYQSSTSISPTTTNYTKNEGDTLQNINCSADCYPACIYTWTKIKNGQTSLASSTGVLSLNILYRSDAASYRCTAKNPENKLSLETTKTIDLKVRYGPDSAKINVSSPYNITEGDTNVSIKCNAECYPGCSYKWKNITSGLTISSNNVLTLQKITKDNAGDLKCLAANEATPYYKKAANSTIMIIVQYAPSVSISLTSEKMKEGETLTLFCNGSGVPASYTYTNLTQTWNNFVINNINKAVEGTEQFSSLYFSSLKLDDSGTYTCSLNNGIRSVSGILEQTASTSIVVEVGPKIFKKDLRFTGSTGGNVMIQLPTYSYPPLAQDSVTIKRYDGFNISRDKFNVTGQIVDTTFYGQPASLNGSLIFLMLNSLVENDFGNYTFEITNKVNKTFAIIDIIAEGPPSPPKLLQIQTGYSIPTFIWEKDFNGGLHQYFVIQTSIADTEMWTNMTNISEKDKMYLLNSTFYKANLTGLAPGTYSARIFAYNVKGISTYVDLEASFTVEKETGPGASTFPVEVVAGVCSAVILVLIVAVAVVAVLKLRKRASKNDENRTKLNSRKGRVGEEDDDDEDEVNTVNPMYVSADEVQATDSTYAQPVKKKKGLDVGDVYAVVDKKKKNDSKEKKRKGKKALDGDIYENAPCSAMKENISMKKVEKAKGKAYDENPYENPLADESNKPKYLMAMETGSRKTYGCITCGKMYCRRYRLSFHQRNSHQNLIQSTECEVCSKKFSSVSNKNIHKRRVHGIDSRLTCSECPSRFATKQDKDEHIRRHHNTTKLVCENCRKEFCYIRNLTRHKSVCGKPKLMCFQCEICQRKYSSKGSLQNHVRAKHRGIKHMCEHCGREFNIRYSLTRHVRNAH